MCRSAPLACALFLFAHAGRAADAPENPVDAALSKLAAADAAERADKRAELRAGAKKALTDFLAKNPTDARADDAALALAGLRALDAKEQARRGWAVVIPRDGDDNAVADARLKREEEFAKARPLFQLAATQYADLATRLKRQLDDKTLAAAPRAKRTALLAEVELARAVASYDIAETYTADDKGARAARAQNLDAARQRLVDLSRNPDAGRVAWLARAWLVEVYSEQDDHKFAADAHKEVAMSRDPASAEGKRLAAFFANRRTFIAAMTEGSVAKLEDANRALRQWLLRHEGPKTNPEIVATRWYLARGLVAISDRAVGPVKPGTDVVLPVAAKKRYEEAEALFRDLSKFDHDYTDRAAQWQAAVGRRLAGKFDPPKP
ncbi:MAG: hypothetical protein FJ304_19055 [Planctomycetes bacterium]|nr:hypothetical protein [Planctomycetota bacterium]